VARDASSTAAIGASTTTRPACCTDVLRRPQLCLFRALASASTALVVDHVSYLVAMTLTPPTVTDWVADSVTSNHTILDAGNLTSIHSPTSTDPSSIIVGNRSALPVISVGDSALPGLFYLNNVLVTPDIIQNLLSVHHFTTDNWCSIEFNPFSLSMKDLSTWNMITRCNSSGPLYTMCLPSHPASSSHVAAPLALVTSTSTWHRCLIHPGVDILSKLSHDSNVICSRQTHDFCHACQLGHHTRLTFVGYNSRVDNNFDLIHCDLWIYPIVSISGYKYYLVILDDHSHFVWTFSLCVKSIPFLLCQILFAYIFTQFDCTIKVVQCDNGCEFDNASSRAFFATKGVIMQMSCPYTSP
jgi:hypothetical protein